MKTLLFIGQNPRHAASLQLIYRSLLILLLALCSSFTTKANVDPDSGSVKVLLCDSDTKEFIPFANVVVYQNGVQVAVATTNMDGECILKNLAPGFYDIKGVYVGYDPREIKKVQVTAGKTTYQSIKLQARALTCCYEVTYCCCCFGCYYDNTGNWWPELWTPYREWFAARKEKRKAKLLAKAEQAKQIKPKQIILSEDPDSIATADSVSLAKVILVETLVKEIKIYPNPASDVLHIEASQALGKVTLMDESGKIIKEERMQEARTSINLKGLANGIYYLNYNENGKTEMKKIVVTN